MIYRITSQNDEKLQGYYDTALKELNDFYGINWVRNLPRLIIVDNRKSIDALFGKKSEGWMIGWSENNNIYVLDKAKFSNESDHKEYSDEEYAMLIKHEMSHSFSSILAKGEVKPKWLWEGIAIYTAGQNSLRTKPDKFKGFLEHFDNGGKDVYTEAGFAVQLLVEKFGKQKILTLISSSKNNSKAEFCVTFKSIFCFDPTYEEFDQIASELRSRDIDVC